MRTLTLLLLTSTVGLVACVGAEENAPLAETQAPATAVRADYVFGLSPYLDREVKDDVYRSIVRLLVEELPLNSNVAIYDAYNLRSITTVAVPKAKAFSSPKTRANQFAKAIGELRQFLAKVHPKADQARLDLEGAIRLPQFCDFLALNLGGGESPPAVLLLGSPLYQDAKEPGFSMVDGYFPSDGHLQATREQSVYGLSTANRPGMRVHWVYFGDPWLSDLHQEKVTRLWTLYLERRGGQLVTFSGDLATGLKAFGQGAVGAPSGASRWAVNPEQTKIEMLRAGRTVEVADWLTGDTNLAQDPPTLMVGPMKIGIRWKENIDLDLYATPRSGAETLFFQHTRSPEGYYYRDHRSSPGREYEFIEFESPVDIREVEAFVNFYKGACPGGPGGEVRIEFEGRIYGAPFSLAAAEGNRGRSGNAQREYWTQIPVQQILRIGTGARAAR